MKLDELVTAARLEPGEPDVFTRARMRAAIARRVRQETTGRATLARGWLTWRARRMVLLTAAMTLLVGTVFATEWRRMRAHVPASSSTPTGELRAAPAPLVPRARAAASVDPAPANDPMAAEARPAIRPSPTRSHSLAEEMSALGHARDALHRKDPASALSALDAYDARFRGGALQQEASALRVFALCDAGRDREGRSLGRQFARRWPRSPLAARVETACGAESGP